MATVRRLVTLADVDDESVATTATTAATATMRISVSARHEAELDDGSRVPLLTDRGWGSTGDWSDQSVKDIRKTARTVVGPDEPFGDRSHEDMAADHWVFLQAVLRRAGVVVDVTELRRLPHDVLLSRRLLARIGGEADAGTTG